MSSAFAVVAMEDAQTEVDNLRTGSGTNALDHDKHAHNRSENCIFCQTEAQL